MARPEPEALKEQMALYLRRVDAAELRRRRMQGLGRPIISWEDHGYRLVAVGMTVHWSQKWRTFHDFLFYYIEKRLGGEWGKAELDKPTEKMHPLLRWYREVCDYQKEHAKRATDGVYTGDMTGVVRAYLGLAYDLYLADHNAKVPDLLLKRLRHVATFEGALYEAYVIGVFAKAGFEIEFEDEGDSTVSHCEFTATHKETGKRFSVEAKAFTTASSRSGASERPPKVGSKLYDALRKNAAHQRIVFIEVSRAGTQGKGEPDWLPAIDREMGELERDLKIEGAQPPAAYVFVTNRGHLHALDSTVYADAGVAYGFRLADFPIGKSARSILEAVEARERHLEADWLFKAMGKNIQIPSTFDDRTPEEVFSPDATVPLRIGETYLVPDGRGGELSGILEDAVVVDSERRAYGTYKLTDGRRVQCANDLTDAEMQRYRASPDTFFGVISQGARTFNTPLEAFDFCYEAYSKSSKEKLLEFMVGWPDPGRLQSLSQAELAKTYCAWIAEDMWARRQLSKGDTISGNV